MAKSHRLNLFDSTCLIVGIIIGSGIYETPATVASAVEYPWEIYWLWTLGGIISLCGALCYAELATTYPESGGDVVYLSKAYGRWAGFLFGWLQTFVARPGDISIMALVFARYIHVLLGTGRDPVPIWPAVAIVILLTLINIVGLKTGKTTQNVLTVGKVIGLIAIVGIAFASASATSSPAAVDSTAESAGGVTKGVALVLILFTYGGWNEMVYVASEVENPRRNISKALVLGTVAVMAIYLITNAAFLSALTLPGMANSPAIATEAVSNILPRYGMLIVATVIAISSAGAINGLILTGARITGAMKSFSPFDWLGTWNTHFQTPVRALVLEGTIAVVVICFARTFENALIYTSAAVYMFYLATCLSTAVLRVTDPETERPFRVPLFPLPLLVFGAGCVWAIRSAVLYKPNAARICFAIVAAGLVAFLIASWLDRKRREAGTPSR